jgi:hypothetical protein
LVQKTPGSVQIYCGYFENARVEDYGLLGRLADLKNHLRPSQPIGKKEKEIGNIPKELVLCVIFARIVTVVSQFKI